MLEASTAVAKDKTIVADDAIPKNNTFMKDAPVSIIKQYSLSQYNDYEM